MPFSLTINRKGIFNKNTVDFEEIVKTLGFQYGIYNDFYVLDEGKSRNNSCIMYNPKQIGRGMFFDGSDASKVEILINIPTSKQEIADFFELAKEISRQFKTVEIQIDDEPEKYSLEQVLTQKDGLTQFSYEQLLRGIERSDDGEREWILTTVMWPIAVDKEIIEEMKSTGDLSGFSKLLHEKQNMDVHYAKPSLMKNSVDDSIIAFYTMAEDCPTLFPIDFNSFLMTDRPADPIRADKGMIDFYLFSEQKLLGGMWDYNEFIKYVMDHGAKKYDRNRILVPSYTKEEIMELTNSIHNYLS